MVVSVVWQVARNVKLVVGIRRGVSMPVRGFVLVR